MSGDTTTQPADRAGARSWLVLALVYVGSRVWARGIAGVAFDDNPLLWFWQYVDPALLAGDALRSIFYQHAQPPLWNLYLAGVTKTCGEAAATCFSITFFGFGAALHAALFALVLRLGVSRRLALGAALLFTVSPASILYESWLFYTYPMAALLAAAAVLVHRSVQGARPRDLAALSALLAAAVLTRSLFHLVWLAFALALVAWPLRREWRRVALCAALPVVLCVAVFAKNAALFGTFSSSSWLGMSLARLAVEPIPPAERRVLAQSGRLGAVSLVKPFSPLVDYPPALRAGGAIDHPVLRAPRKSTTAPNYNHAAYLGISRAYGRDARAMIRARPDVYLGSVAEAWTQFALAPSLYLFLETNRARIPVYSGLFSGALYGFALEPLPTDRAPTREDVRYRMRPWGAAFVLLALFGVGVAALRGAREAFGAEGDRALGATLLFSAGTTLYVAVLGNAFEIGENNRFRFMVEPLVFAQIAWLLDGLRPSGSDTLPKVETS